MSLSRKEKKFRQALYRAYSLALRLARKELQRLGPLGSRLTLHSFGPDLLGSDRICVELRDPGAAEWDDMCPLNWFTRADAEAALGLAVRPSDVVSCVCEECAGKVCRERVN